MAADRTGIAVTDRQLRLLAELIGGLQVARSISPAMFGTALSAYDGLRREFGLFGWQDADVIEAILRRKLVGAGT